MDHSDDKTFLAHIQDLARRADHSGYITFSDFLDDHKQSLLSQSVGRLSVCMDQFGGFEGAERVVVAFYPDYLKDTLDEAVKDALCVLKITLADRRFLKRIPEHRDYLGAIMGTGIKREMIGDVIVNEEGAFVVVLREMAAYLIQEMTSVGAAIVSVREATGEEIPEPERGRESVISLSSLRLDALVAHGFKMGRTEASKVIRAGLVFRNGSPIQDPDKSVALGDKITLRGKGRIILREEKAVSKSGRKQILIEQFGK